MWLWLRLALSVLITLVIVVLVARRVDAVPDDLRVAPWAVPAYLGTLLIYFFARAGRWWFLVRPLGPVRFRALLAVACAGFLWILLLPWRLGEFVRLLSLARYLAMLVQFWAVAAGLGVDLDGLQIAAATPIGQLAGMVGITPGALGIQEAGWLGALAWVGVDAPAIAVFVLGQRLVLTAYFALLSLISWLLLRRRRPSCPPGQVG